jgi:hypothetical protein
VKKNEKFEKENRKSGKVGKSREPSQTLVFPLYQEIQITRNMDTKVNPSYDASTNVFLTGAILLANMDYSGLMDYAIKAAIGGVLWMGFKLGTDYISYVIKRKRNKQ